MSKMLGFYESLWLSARELATSGQATQALRTLLPLLNSSACPERQQRLAHRLAARIHSAQGRYAKARKHLREADRLQPGDAEVHFERGQAYEVDPYGCDRRAAKCHAMAYQLETRNTKYQAALGRALVRIGRVKSGVKHLKEAAQSLQYDAKVLNILIDGFCEAGKLGLARQVLNQAQFRLSTTKQAVETIKLLRFRLTAKGQQKRPADCSRFEKPTLVLTNASSQESGTRRIRVDPASRTAPHIMKLPTYRTERSG